MMTDQSFLQYLCSQFKDVCYRVKLQPRGGSTKQAMQAPDQTAIANDRTILNGITGLASPGELLAILGPSGCGKSTLLTALAGRLPAGSYTGSVLANGHDLTKPSWRRRTGFVTQDDVLYPHLTVKETLLYCAMLRLPKTLAAADKAKAVDAVMAELGLGKCGDTIVGNGFIRGVSGGERKRVSIGHEMLVNPSLLLLDEPTSGLDSTAAYRLVTTLAGMGRKGRTVVMSVHQPSSRVYQAFDSVLLLSEGSCLYFGRGSNAMSYFASLGFSPSFPMNPADFMLDLANGQYVVHSFTTLASLFLITSNIVYIYKYISCMHARID